MSPIAFSFRVRGSYAAFMDPRTTTSGVTYCSPTRSAVVGMLGAMLGIGRPTEDDVRSGELYSKDFISLLHETKIGIRVNGKAEKQIYHTNHVSFKESRTMPTKTEVLLSPDYTIFVLTNDKIGNDLMSIIKNKNFAYPIYFGRAYCKAMVCGSVNQLPYKLYNKKKFLTTCVVLHAEQTMHNISIENGHVMTESQTHHYVNDGRLLSRIIPRTVPLEGATMYVTWNGQPLAQVLEINPKVGECVVVF